jgi:hypothetical protein
LLPLCAKLASRAKAQASLRTPGRPSGAPHNRQFPYWESRGNRLFAHIALTPTSVCTHQMLDLQAWQAHDACMGVQYTIRGISDRLDKKIREFAANEGKSLNEALLDLLKSGTGLAEEKISYTDLDHLAGSWVSDPEFDKAIEEMDHIDPELWK